MFCITIQLNIHIQMHKHYVPPVSIIGIKDHMIIFCTTISTYKLDYKLHYNCGVLTVMFPFPKDKGMDPHQHAQSNRYAQKSITREVEEEKETWRMHPYLELFISLFEQIENKNLTLLLRRILRAKEIGVTSQSLPQVVSDNPYRVHLPLGSMSRRHCITWPLNMP